MDSHNPRGKHAYFLGPRNKLDGLELLKRMEAHDLNDYEKARMIYAVHFECSECGETSRRYAPILSDIELTFEMVYSKPCLKCLLKTPLLKCSRCGKPEPCMSDDLRQFPPICSECRKKNAYRIWREDEKLWKFFIQLYPNLNQLSFWRLKKKWASNDKRLQTTIAAFVAGHYVAEVS